VNDAESSARARRWLGVAASVVSLGVAVAGTVSRGAGGLILIAGWVVFVAGLHMFGRTGTEGS
jgi:hypothetical protein